MGVLYLKPEGGLANRLMALATGYSYARHYGLKLSIVWTKTEHVCCDWEDLFSNTKVTIVSREDVSCDVIKHVVNSSTLRNTGDDAVLNLSSDQDHYLSTNCILGLPGEKRGNGFWCFSKSCTVIQDAFNFFGVSEKVEALVKSVLKVNDSYESAIHVRRGAYDVPSTVADWNLLDDDKYYSVLKHYNVKRAFVATDSEESKYYFCSKLEHPHTMKITSFNKAEDAVAIQEAFAELLLLSKAKQIFGVQGSSFAYYAALLSSADYIAIPAKGQTENVNWLVHTFETEDNTFKYKRLAHSLDGESKIIRASAETLD